MRNNWILIVILISIIFLSVIMLRGINIMNLEILSISQIIEKDKNLNEKIKEAGTLTSQKYPETVQSLETSFDDYSMTKNKYEQLSGFKDSTKMEMYETKQYDISYLWKVLGNYTENRNLKLEMSVTVVDVTKNLYNLNFAVSGSYIDIIQFIQDIEEDSDLYFRIYNFKMSGSSDIINSSFVVKNISVEPSTLKAAQVNTEELFKQ